MIYYLISILNINLLKCQVHYNYDMNTQKNKHKTSGAYFFKNKKKQSLKWWVIASNGPAIMCIIIPIEIKYFI